MALVPVHFVQGCQSYSCSPVPYGRLKRQQLSRTYTWRDNEILLDYECQVCELACIRLFLLWLSFYLVSALGLPKCVYFHSRGKNPPGSEKMNRHVPLSCIYNILVFFSYLSIYMQEWQVSVGVQGRNDTHYSHTERSLGKGGPNTILALK